MASWVCGELGGGEMYGTRFHHRPTSRTILPIYVGTLILERTLTVTEFELAVEPLKRVSRASERGSFPSSKLTSLVILFCLDDCDSPEILSVSTLVVDSSAVETVVESSFDSIC